MTPAQKRAMEYLAGRKGWSEVGTRTLSKATVRVLSRKGWVEMRARRGSDVRGSGYVPNQWVLVYEDWYEIKLTPKGEHAAVANGIRKPFEDFLTQAQALAKHWENSPEDHEKWTKKVEHLTELLA